MNINSESTSEWRFGFLTVLGLTTSVLLGCSLPNSELANEEIKNRVNQYSDEVRPADKWTITCGKLPEAKDARYCFHQTGPNPQYTIWFFHGDSERVFQWSPFYQRPYLDLEKGLQLPAVNIVTVSFGSVWVITDTPNRTLEPTDARVDVFSERIEPFFERNFHPAKPYVAMGHSQGGANVATLCAALPDMWSKCVLLNPMLPSCNPFQSWPLCPSLFGPLGAIGPSFLIRANYSKAEWRETQPFISLRKTKKLPKSFVTACSTDDFGLFAGPKAWSDQARQLGFDSTWAPVTKDCNHFQWPAKEVLRFLNDT
jgi:pimeloyl-ACP methyl ester carboxylesterase